MGGGGYGPILGEGGRVPFWVGGGVWSHSGGHGPILGGGHGPILGGRHGPILGGGGYGPILGLAAGLWLQSDRLKHWSPRCVSD